jgi:hypothetical protein
MACIFSHEKYMTDKELSTKASSMLNITSSGLFGIYGWDIKGRKITSVPKPGCKISRNWYLNGVRVNYRYILLLTYKWLGLINNK